MLPRGRIWALVVTPPALALALPHAGTAAWRLHLLYPHITVCTKGRRNASRGGWEGLGRWRGGGGVGRTAGKVFARSCSLFVRVCMYVCDESYAAYTTIRSHLLTPRPAQLLAAFFFEGKKYVVAAPLEPVLIIGSPVTGSKLPLPDVVLSAAAKADVDLGVGDDGFFSYDEVFPSSPSPSLPPFLAPYPTPSPSTSPSPSPPSPAHALAPASATQSCAEREGGGGAPWQSLLSRPPPPHLSHPYLNRACDMPLWADASQPPVAFMCACSLVQSARPRYAFTVGEQRLTGQTGGGNLGVGCARRGGAGVGDAAE